jgi:hypothetical protein
MGVYAVITPFALLIPSHAFDMSWPPHAKFHLYWASSKLFALGISHLLIALFPLRDAQPWSWFALLANLVFGGLSIIPASRIAHGPIAPLSGHNRSTLLALLTFLSTILGLALAFPAIFGPT